MDNSTYIEDERSSERITGALGNIYPHVLRRNSRAGGVLSIDDALKDPEDPPPAYPEPKVKKNGKVKKSYKKVKAELQNNKVTTKFFPPQGDVATALTIGITIISVFFCARTVLGPIAAPGGAIFSLLILILLAKIAGELVLLFAAGLSKLVGVEIRIPGLLGMMAVGILLKNVPYNFGQFGRDECIGNHTQGTFVDSLHDFDINSTEFIDGLMGFEVHPEDLKNLDIHVRPRPGMKENINNHYKQKYGEERYIYVGNDTEEYDYPGDDGLDVHARARNPQTRINVENHFKEKVEKNAGGGRNVTKSQNHGHSGDHHARRRRSDDHGASHAAPVDPCKKRFIGHELDPVISRTLRSICLTVILLMAGLELDPPKLWKLKWIVLRTTFIPCVAEAVCAAAYCHFLLGWPFKAGLCFGFVLCGVSPAVIIPSLVNLAQRGYGVKKGIPTLVIATCSADDLVAIGGFGIFLAITFNPDAPILDLAFHGPIEVIMGIVFGVGWGYLAQWVPNQHHQNMVFFRFLILFSGGLVALFGAHLIHYDGAGGLACVIMAFVAGIQWRKEGWGDHNPIMDIFTKMWIVLAPVIFSLIGTNIQADKIDGSTLGMGVLVIFLSMLSRAVATYFSAMFGGLNTKEKIFLSIAWIPKATVQAALGPVFLDNALRNSATLASYIPIGEQILNMAVISIVMTAPLGAILILALGPLLLTNDGVPADPHAVDHEEEEDGIKEEEDPHKSH